VSLNAVAAAGAGFLVAVLWFDLMFDVQVRGRSENPLPGEVLDSISAYYRRVTTEAQSMSRLIPLVMLVTLAAIGGEISKRAAPAWSAWLCLALALSAIGLAFARTVRNAVRLGAAQDAAEERSRLARIIFADHVYCLAAMGMVAGLQLFAGL
jgi:hypothetical protein